MSAAHPLRAFAIVRELLRDAGILPARDAPRHWHWLAAIFSTLYQCLWFIGLIWVVYAQFLHFPPLQPEGDGGGRARAIEVTFINPAPPAATPPLPVPLPEPDLFPTPLAEVETLSEPLPEPVAQPAPPPEPAPEPVPAPPLPLVVTEVTEPDSTFTLQVPEFQSPEAPDLPASAVPIPERTLPLADIPLVQQPELHPPVSTRPVSTPTADITAPELAIREREIPAPLPDIELRPLPTPALAPVELAAVERDIIAREIALTPLQPAPPSSTDSAPEPAPTAEPPVREIALTPATPSDSWDTPARNSTDTGSGLLDADGRPRLAGTGGSPGGGLPPGTVMEEFANIDRMGNWLKRRTPDFQAGALDALWVPHENILEEWVRRSIKNILIPIPGTNKVIRCTVVLLMLGGGCGITDPNLLDIEATSRPPPDIPFKPELHEDQDGLGTQETRLPGQKP